MFSHQARSYRNVETCLIGNQAHSIHINPHHGSNAPFVRVDTTKTYPVVHRNPNFIV